MRASVLHRGVAWAAGALVLGGLLPTSAFAESTDASRVQAVDGDLSIEQMASDATPVVGDQVTFKVRALNGGTTAEGGAVVTVVLPATFTFVSAQPPVPAADWDCAYPTVGFTGSIVCTKPTDLPAGDEVLLEFVATPGSEGEATNTATVASTDVDPIPANNTSELTLTVGAAPAAPAPGAGQPVEPGFPADPPRPPGPSPYWHGGGWDDCDFDCF